MNGSPIVELENVSVSYENGIHALEDISLTVREEDFLGLVGPNGAGKTTLIKVILGLITNCCGVIKLFGKPHNAEGRKRIGYVPQKMSPLEQSFPATVQEVVASGLTAKKGLLNSLDNADKIQIEKVLKTVEIDHIRNRRIGELSGGQQQRVLIAKALVSEPDLLILDEPVTGIDFGSQAKFYALLETLNKHLGLTLILASHDISAISAFSTKVACINKRLFYHGESQDFFKSEEFSRVYGYPIKMMLHRDHSV